MRDWGLSPRQIVFEDEIASETVRKVYDHFRQQTGLEPTMLFPGAGGYWWRLVHRDTLSSRHWLVYVLIEETKYAAAEAEAVVAAQAAAFRHLRDHRLTRGL